MTPQSVKDAMTDAQSLRLAKMTASKNRTGWKRTDIYKAEAYGSTACAAIDPGGVYGFGVDAAWRYALMAAHAAFRAVPSLRGTDEDEKALHGALCLRSGWLNAPCGCGVGL